MKPETFGHGRTVAVAMALLLMALLPTALAARADTTLQNLQTSYNAELNARERYTVFAVRADADGYHQVASLFRAAARAEDIHAANHAAVIARKGGRAQATLQRPVVGTTRENLVASFRAEVAERNTIYPRFFQQARREKDRKATQTFRFALRAEQDHATLYAAATRGLRPSRPGAYRVCPECGHTASALPDKRCPTCSTKRGKFLLVT